MAIKKISANLLGSNAVHTSNIAAGAIDVADIADNSITAAKLSVSTSPQFTNLTLSGNLHAGDGTDISMDGSANGQIEADGNGYQGAIALDSNAMHVYHNSSSRDLILGTNETARLTIGGTGTFTFHSNNLQSIGTITSGAIAATGDIDASGLLKVGVNDTEYANNYLRFKSAGAGYIDHNTVGQDINFRISNSSALDTTIMTLDAGVSSVGINQTSPSSTYKLDVGGAIRSAGAAPGLALKETDLTADQNWLLGSYSGTFAIRDVTGGTYPVYVEQATPSSTLYLDNAGRVGIRLSTPRTLLNVQSTVGASSYTGAGPGDLIRASGSGAGNWIASEDDGAMAYFGIDAGRGKFAAYNYATTAEMNIILGQDRMFIKNDGTVGIGTQQPSTLLTIGDGTGSPYITIDKSATGENGILFKNAGNNKGKILLDSNEYMQFYINNSVNAMTIDESGNVTFGEDIKVSDQIRIKADNNYLEVDQTTATNLRFYLTGHHTGGIKRIGSSAGGSFRPDQYSTGSTAAQYPAHAEWDDENTGVYFPGADQVGLTAGGEVRILARSPASGSKTMLSINTDGYANAGQVNHYLGAGNADNGGYRMFSGTFSEIINCVTASTTASSLRYWHIKTNIATNENIMFKATARGYAYGNSGHDIHVTRTGYMYSPNAAVISTQATNHGGGSHTISYYNSSDSYLVFVVDFVGSYYTGATFDIMFPAPAGYSKDFKVQAHQMNANSSGVY